MAFFAGLLPIVCALGAAIDPQALFHEARAKVVLNLQRLPNYTCVQTVTRSYFQRESPRRSCPEMDAGGLSVSEKGLRLEWTDGLRFDVTEGSGHELFSWAGDKSFQGASSTDLMLDGAVGSGDFGAFLTDIFGAGKARFFFQGVHAENGAAVAEYRFEVKQATSHYVVKSGDQRAVIGYHGSFEIEAETADLLRLTIASSEMHSLTEQCWVGNEVSYQHVAIGGRDFILPKTSRLVGVDVYGNMARNETVYGSCHEYVGESKIRFLEEGDAAGNAEAPSAGALLTAGGVLPVGLGLSIRLTTEVRSGAMIAGDPVEGVLTGPLRARDGQVLAPKGARLHGRLMRMQQNFYPEPSFKVALRFETLESSGAEVPVYLKPVVYPTAARPFQNPILSASRQPNELSILFPGQKGLRLKPGLVTHWESTAAPPPSVY